MTDIEKAADVAASVLPGPIGEALARFFSDGVATDDADTNPYLADLADRIVYANEIREGVEMLCPDQATEFYYGLAVQFAVNGEAAVVADALRLADTAVSYLFSLAGDVPAKHAPRGYVNATARVMYLTGRITTYNAELVDLTRMLGGGAA